MENQQTWNRQQMEEQIKSAITDLTPDIWNRLDLSVPQESQETGRNKRKSERKKISFMGRAGTMAAAACLCLILGGGFSYYEFGQIVTVVGLDVNPSVELCLNRQDRVVKSIALNEDGEAVIYQKEIKGRKLEEAVDSVITTMTEQGYLKKDETERSTVLVTVSSKKKEDRKQELCQNLSSNVEHSLAANEVQAVVYEQPAVVEEKARQEIIQLVEEYQISQGKASFIQALVEENENVHAEDVPRLAAMTMGEISAQIDQQSYQLKSEVQITAVTEETIRRVREEEMDGRISVLAQEETEAKESESGTDKENTRKEETEPAVADGTETENKFAETADKENVGDTETNFEKVLETVGNIPENSEKVDGLVGETKKKGEKEPHTQEAEEFIQAADIGKTAAGAEQTALTGNEELNRENLSSDKADQLEENQLPDESEAEQPVTNPTLEEESEDRTGIVSDSDSASQDRTDKSQGSEESAENQDGAIQEQPEKSEETEEILNGNTPLGNTGMSDSSVLPNEKKQEELVEEFPTDGACMENISGEEEAEPSSKKNPGTVRTDSVPYETEEKTAVIKRDELHQILEQMENETEWHWEKEAGDPAMPGPGTVEQQGDKGQKDERKKIIPGPGMEESIWEREFLDQEDQVARWLHGPGISPNGDRLTGYSIRNSTAAVSENGSFAGLFNNRGIIRRDSRSKLRINAWYCSLVENFEEIR